MSTSEAMAASLALLEKPIVETATPTQENTAPQENTPQQENMATEDIKPSEPIDKTSLEPIQEPLESTQPESTTEEDVEATEEKPWYEQTEESNSTESPTQTNDDSAFFSSLKEKGHEFRSIEDLASKLNEYKERSEQNIPETNVFANEQIQKANEIAAAGGDYASYLGQASVDYNSIDPEIFFYDNLRSNPHFQNPENGAFNQERYDDYVSDLSEGHAAIEGAKLKNQIIANQQSTLNQIHNDAKKHHERVNSDLNNALKSTKELYGMKLTDKVRQDIFKNLTSGESFNFKKQDGSLNMEKMIKADYVLRNINNIVKTEVQRARSEGVKSIMDEATNVNLGNNKGSFADPSTAKVTSDPLTSAMNRMRAGGSL